MTVVAFKKLDPAAILPQYMTAGAAGMDLTSVEEVVLQPGDYDAVRTGLGIAIPEGYEAQVRPRSGLAFKNGVTVLNTPGTIDSDYRGEIKVILINHGNVPFRVAPGDRIAQLVIAKVEQPETKFVDELDATLRGAGGFGSTGV